MLSDHETAGGAAIAACRLADGLIRQGTEVIRITGSAEGENHAWKTSVLRLKLPEYIFFKMMKKVTRSLANRMSTILINKRLNRLLKDLRPDAINVHNLHGAGWEPAIVGVCAQHAPTVWTLHDMWSFTGRCAYSYDCHKFIKGCDGSCPTHMEYPPLSPKLIPRAWKHRRDLFSNNPQLIAITPSRWLASLAKTGLWEGHHIEVIPNGLDLDSYHSANPVVACRELGINTQDPILMVAAQKISDRRKGWNILVEALKRVRRRPLTLIVLGEGDPDFQIEGINLRRLGYINDEQTKVHAYSASDIFVHPALEDNLPNVIMEAIACGTPVVAFNAGGMAEMFHPDKTGWLADSLSPEALASTLDKACNDLKHGKNMRNACRVQAEEEYDQALQAKRYSRIFRSLIERVEDKEYGTSC